MSEQPHEVTITPKTHFRAPIGWIVVALVGVFELARTGFAAYTAVVTTLNAHIADEDRHLDPKYQKEHGRPVGKWDLDVAQSETQRKLGEVNASLDQLKTMVINQPRHR